MSSVQEMSEQDIAKMTDLLAKDMKRDIHSVVLAVAVLTDIVSTIIYILPLILFFALGVYLCYTTTIHRRYHETLNLLRNAVFFQEEKGKKKRSKIMTEDFTDAQLKITPENTD